MKGESSDTNPGETTGDDAQLVQAAARIERLLDEIQGMVAPHAWPRIEELVRGIVSLYGGGLERVFRILDENEIPDARVRERLCGDELVKSLMLLHGLHPLGTVERVQRALDEVRPYLGSHAGDVELVGVDGQGVVRLRLLGTCRGCPSSGATVEHAISRVMEDHAPEFARIEVEHGDPAAVGQATDSTLVTLETRRSAEQPGARWVAIEGVDSLPVGGRTAVDVAGVPLLVIRTPRSLVAYRNGCTGCGARLDDAVLEAETLQCSGCRRRYDLTHAGRAEDAEGASLDPAPLLTDANASRVAVPETYS